MAASKLQYSFKPNILITFASFIIVVAGLRAASPLVVPLLLAAFIAVVTAPPLFWLKSKGIPTTVALFTVVSVVLMLVLLIATFIGTSLDDFSKNLPFYHEQLKDKTAGFLSWIHKLGVDVSMDGFYDVFNPSIAMKLAVKMLSGLSGVLTNGFLILLTVIFILFEASSFPAKLRAVFKDAERSMPYFHAFIKNVQRYMAIKTLVSIGTGVAVAIWLSILGVDYALLWGLFAFLLNYIPNIGSVLAAIPAVLLSFIQLGPLSVLLTVSGYIAVNVVVGNIIEPRIMGRGLGLSTLVVFISLIFWGWVFGPVGMLLSVPLTMTLKIAFDSRDDTRWLAILLGSDSSEHRAEDVPLGSEGTETDTNDPL